MAGPVVGSTNVGLVYEGSALGEAWVAQTLPI